MADKATTEAVSRDPGTPDKAVDDADDMRGFFFRRRMHERKSWIWATVIGLLAAGGLAIASPLLAPAGAIAGVLLVILVVFFLADADSEKAFFSAYAEQHGLTFSETGNLPGATPLLRKGDERKAKDLLEGTLAPGVKGTLAMYTYTEVYYDKNGRHETDYKFTVALCSLPRSRRFAPALYANRKSGFRFLEKAEDAFRSNERLKFESERLDDEYEIFAGKGYDENWMRQLFSPTFIVWLTDTAPDKFAFELEDGVLCCNIKGHKQTAKDLDLMSAAAAHIAGRLREEMNESEAASGPEAGSGEEAAAEPS